MTAKYHCNYCDEDIKKVRVKCGECPDFDLCLKCFSSGAEIGKHKNKHKYQLIDCGTFPIFDSTPKWKAIEEMALLESVELFGFGNWNDVAAAAFLGTKTPEEVKEHFCNYYVYGNIGKHTWDLLRNTTLEIKDHTCDDDRPMSPSFYSSAVPEINLDPVQQQQLGYMPKRDDFEREYDNDAENVISYLAISPEDDEIDKELKAIHVDVYKQRLTERFRRKTIAREYNLVNLFFAKDEEPPRVDDDEDDDEEYMLQYKSKSSKHGSPPKEGPKELDLEFMSNKEAIEKKMRVLSQFQSQEEQRLLIENLHREYELKKRLKELLKIRRQNLKKLNDGKEIKSPKKKEIKKTSKMNLTASTGSTYSPISKKSNGEESSTSLTPVKIEKESLKSSKQPGARNGDLDSDSDSDCRTSNSFKKSLASDTNHELNSLNKNSKDKFDVYSMPSTRLLSEQEKSFCNKTKLRPSQYLNLKTLILKEHVQKKGKNSSNGKAAMENIDKITHKKMVNFMCKCGWLN